MRQREICTAAERRREIANHLAITVHRLARAHLLFHVEPVSEPIANLVIVQRFAGRALQNFANDLFRLLLCERTVFRMVFGALGCETHFQRFCSLVCDSLRRAVFSLLALERLDCDLG
jgi:hypothetical protein